MFVKIPQSYLCLISIILFFVSQTTKAQPMVYAIPNDTILQGNDALAFGLYANDFGMENGSIANVFGIRFILSSPNTLISGDTYFAVDTIALANALITVKPMDTQGENGNQSGGNGNNGNGIGGNNGSSTGTSTSPLSSFSALLEPAQSIEVLITRPTPTNGNIYGRIADISNIMTIDDLERIFGECSAATVILSNIELITKVDLTTMDITSSDIVTALGSESFTVEFCPKCELTKENSIVNCLLDNTFNATIYFEGNPNINYTLSDNFGTTQIVNNGLYGLGPYPNDSLVLISIRHPNGIEVCTLPVETNCVTPLPSPTCFDGIQNQGEKGIDCGGPCVPCNNCDMLINAIATRENIASYSVELTLSGSETYTLTDGNLNLSGEAGTYTFGPYSNTVTAQILVYSATSSCRQLLDFSYDKATVCQFAPNNDECADAVGLNLGENGPFSNYCATNANTDPTNPACLVDNLSKTVWFSFVGNGQQMMLYASSNSTTISIRNRESNLQLLIYNTCPANTLLACSDDYIDEQPRIILPTVNGQTYYVLVDGFGDYDAEGEFYLHLESCVPALLTSSTQTYINCSAPSMGDIDLSVTNAPAPHSYLWSNGATTQDLNNVIGGDYSVAVTDSLGCITTATINLDAPTDTLSITSSQVLVPANPTSPFQYQRVEISIEGGEKPYNYQWQREGYVRLDTDETLGLITIYYSNSSHWAVTITDANGCEKSYNNYSTINNTPNQQQILSIPAATINPASSLSAPNGSIMLTTEGGTAPYQYEWSNGVTTANLLNVSSGWYAVTVTDSSNPMQTTYGWYWVPTQLRGRGKSDALFNTQINPNPIGDMAQIQLNSTVNTFLNVWLYDAAGKPVQLLFNAELISHQNYQFNIQPKVPNGMYWLVLHTTDGKHQSYPIVVHK